MDRKEGEAVAGTHRRKIANGCHKNAEPPRLRAQRYPNRKTSPGGFILKASGREKDVC